MSMRRYYVICHLTWAVLSSFHYMFEEGLDESAKSRWLAWSKQREKAANWLISEGERVVEGNYLPASTLEALDRLLDAECDRLIVYPMCNYQSSSNRAN